MRTLLKWTGIGLGTVAFLLIAGYTWAAWAADAKLSRTFTAHEARVPFPMPLTEAERQALDPEDGEGDGDPEQARLEALALERAITRGKHLVHSRFVCIECHGADFGGGVMVDDPAMGRLLGPNLTSGEGSVTTDYTMADWDRIVRHGIRKDGKPAVMPSEDFVDMSDRELSDIVAYIRSLPPVDRHTPPSSLGPVGKLMLAMGKWRLSADLVRDHRAAHAAEPPEAAETVEFGKHLAQVCTGCHRASFEGGPIAQGPPGWAPARNLTPHSEGLEGWSFSEFERVMREGIRPDGSRVLEPMTLATPFAAKMTDTELRALWKYLQSLPPVPNGH